MGDRYESTAQPQSRFLKKAVSRPPGRIFHSRPSVPGNFFRLRGFDRGRNFQLRGHCPDEFRVFGTLISPPVVEVGNVQFESKLFAKSVRNVQKHS